VTGSKRFGGQFRVGSGSSIRELERVLSRIKLTLICEFFGGAAADVRPSASTGHLGGGIESEMVAGLNQKSWHL
jgi:hypothetical protein